MTPQELIAIIEQSPELQQAIRKYVLTEEFLAIPARLDRMESDIADLKASQGRLEQGQTRLEDRINKLDERMDQLNGYRYEQKAIKNCRSVITEQTGMGRVRIRFSQANHPEDPVMLEQMDLASDSGRISQAEEAALWSADLIVSAFDKTSQERVNIVVEASVSLSTNDLDRAKTRAATLEKATSERTLAAVIYARADGARIRQAERDDVRVLRMPDEQ